MEDDEPWTGVCRYEPGSIEWVMIGEEAEYSAIIICCDPKNPNFGNISLCVTNCAEGKPVALSLVELMRGMYWQHTLMVKEYGLEALKQYCPSFWSGSESRLEKNSFDYFRSIRGWTDNDSGLGKKELPAVRDKFPPK
eukprot:CAMPEP_0168546178 /NCGR_PEP_ID=MMETSP0413-20121227/3360_1 /TAXON_ID=136452 /ORGANISM="Filamoeba nolandi, Strain NC-AS-23-1" /LENGTH=137 /DNA_ID=CAMNT_0008576339 /DNA_START=543 /DNA_END=956 /DNA_ORIENTATION=-